MKNLFTILCMLTVLTFVGCTGSDSFSDEGKRERRLPQPSDTLFTLETAMEVYATQPERALQIIDSAENVGNLSALRADLLRAMVYSRTSEEMNYDSAILIGERLMLHDSVVSNVNLQEDVLEILLNACRMRKDYEQAMHWATSLGNLYRRQGEETNALRTDAEIGTFLIRLGQQSEGLSKIDSIINQLHGKRRFNELDATIISLKRKAEICIEKDLYDEAIPAAQRILDLVDDYERHPDDFHDGTVREPSETARPDYIDFYRGKAFAYLAAAYAWIKPEAGSITLEDARQKAYEYLALYEQTAASQSLTGRFMIAPTLGKLEKYDQMLAVFDEVEQRLGTDTVNDNFTIMLQFRARAAAAQGHYAEANGYWKRYVALTEQIYESLLQGKAHLYAARFHAQEQQHEIEQQREATRRAVMSRTTIGLTGLLILLFALYAAIQWNKTQRHNRILAQQITEAVEYKEKYKELKRSVEADGSDAGSSRFEIRSKKGEGGNLKSPSQDSQPANPVELPPSTTNPADLPDAELLAYLRDIIEREKLFLNPNFERQTLINRTGLSKERIGTAFARSSNYERFTTYVRELRLDYAVRLMNEQPNFTIEQVCQASGFANADTFTRNFKAKYGMTPTAYRGMKA